MSSLDDIYKIEGSTKEQLNKLSQGKEIHLSMSEGGDTPGLPYNGSCINLRKNLLPGTKYLLSLGVPPKGLGSIAACINNIVEMISYLIIHQNTENFNELETGQKTIKIENEKQFQKIIEILEQNRKNIKFDIDQIRNLAEEKHETLFQNQQRIINRLDERTSSNNLEEKLKELSEKMDSRFKQLEDQHKSLREYLKQNLE